MAITTLDGVLAGMQPPQFFTKPLSGVLVAGRPFSPWYLGGLPGAGAAPAATLAGAAIASPVNGALPFANGALKQYLARFMGVASGQPGMLLLCDRLWANGGIGITLTTAQTVNSVAFPARDHAGTVNGDGVLIGVEVSVITGAGVPTLTMNYTNEAGVTGRTATNADATVASSAVGSFYRMGLMAGDRGVRSIQTFTLSATWTSGTINLVAYRPIVAVAITNDGRPGAEDALTSGFPELHDNSALWPIFLPSSTATTSLGGSFVQTNG